MPHYAFLAETPLDPNDITEHRMRALRMSGVPYTDEEIANAKADLLAQADPNADSAKLLARYPKANVVPGDGHQVTEAGCPRRLPANARHAGEFRRHQHGKAAAMSMSC